MAVLESCLSKRALSFIYNSLSRRESTRRTVDPYNILNYMGNWHLIGYCHMRKDLRDFVLSRMSKPNITDQQFTILPQYQNLSYLDAAFGIYKGKKTRNVTLRFTPANSAWIKGQVWHAGQHERLLEDGSLELTFPVANYAEILMEVLKHGSGVEVIKPQALRDLVKAEVKRISALY